MKKKKLDSCDSVIFRGGQILIHESKGQTIVEIHTKLGWRMSKFSSPSIGGDIHCTARTALHYSKQLYQRDKSEVDQSAAERALGKMRGVIWGRRR